MGCQAPFLLPGSFVDPLRALSLFFPRGSDLTAVRYQLLSQRPTAADGSDSEEELAAFCPKVNKPSMKWRKEPPEFARVFLT